MGNTLNRLRLLDVSGGKKKEGNRIRQKAACLFADGGICTYTSAGTGGPSEIIAVFWMPAG